jgi:hypothetical protein
VEKESWTAKDYIKHYLAFKAVGMAYMYKQMLPQAEVQFEKAKAQLVILENINMSLNPTDNKNKKKIK